ncbi:AMP-binding protein [Maribacter sp. 2308TA10-17]|uniref:AMP-binding protein n=1 Tax=Maribacter sp. 2308TA10-17 TaxID=3386276 RepID=UPI0039BD1ACE
MTIGDYKIHTKFKLNGVSYSKSELKDLGYDLVKEGSLYETAIGEFLSEWLDDKSFVEVQTSGSTGKPKTIVLQKQQMVNSAQATGSYFNLKSSNSALLCLPAEYIAGKMMLVRAMILGLELDYVEPSSSPLLKVSKNYDFAAMVPLQLENSIKQIERIRTLIIGGAAISNSLKDKLQTQSTKIFETYGMTETITHIAVKKVNHIPNETENCFKALANVVFSKDDRDCLVISASRVSNAPVITNDIVDLISETEFEWLGRYDNVLNSGGIKLFPEQIEAKLGSHIVNRFFVVGIPDEKLGEKLVLIVENEIDARRVVQELKDSPFFNNFEIPKQVYVVDKFVLTDNGKIRRAETLKLIENKQ